MPQPNEANPSKHSRELTRCRASNKDPLLFHRGAQACDAGRQLDGVVNATALCLLKKAGTSRLSRGCERSVART